ncbi:RING-H2 finger protein ATL74-like [Diospyros lotus]|uniref:RING-H2 finger protein ATL74-like n=1 Tax=Diospyros lotus TaxID=55363 RepID=UPI0022515615|nr:RING-H2 finger protein ATL74-like [Diospyros lotus]
MPMERQQQPHLRRLLRGADAGLQPPPVAAANATKTGTSLASTPTDTNFDSNMVIILAALLCALICALGLNSIVRCALRFTQRFELENPDGVGARLGSTGLKKDTLSQIPVVVYNSGVETPATECPICLGEFADGEQVRILPKCNHGFHVKCIDTWLVCHSSCPTCRQQLLELNHPSTLEERASRI